MPDFFLEARGLFKYSRQLRRDFHMHPEIGYQEHRTSRIVAEELNALGIEFASGIAETGVVGLIPGRRDGRTVLLRFDMDALPIQEETRTEYSSQNPGVMHACGHDGHTAIGLTVAKLLYAHRDEFSGNVKLVFQPAEEGLGGAERMIAEGILESPRVDYSLGLHLWNEKPVGWVAATSGPMMASGDIFEIEITGKGGHGALPNTTIDPVVAAAAVIQAIQTVVSRNLSPLKTGVISVTQIQAGSAFNIIPENVKMAGTIRAFDDSDRDQLIRRLNEIVTAVCTGYGCQGRVNLHTLTPAVVNDADLVKYFTDVFAKIVPGLILEPGYRSMVSEDMAFFLRENPGYFFFLGSSNAERNLNYGHHHPKFDFDEDALPIGAALLAGSAFALLNRS